eukprot:15455774-Alexandrium_andersonii.AAC.1
MSEYIAQNYTIWPSGLPPRGCIVGGWKVGKPRPTSTQVGFLGSPDRLRSGGLEMYPSPEALRDSGWILKPSFPRGESLSYKLLAKGVSGPKTHAFFGGCWLQLLLFREVVPPGHQQPPVGMCVGFVDTPASPNHTR